MVTSYFTPEMEICPFSARAMKNMQYNPYVRPNRRNSRVLGNLDRGRLMVMSDFKPEVELQPFRACAVKNTKYNRYLRPNRRYI